MQMMMAMISQIMMHCVCAVSLCPFVSSQSVSSMLKHHIGDTLSIALLVFMKHIQGKQNGGNECDDGSYEVVNNIPEIQVC